MSERSDSARSQPSEDVGSDDGTVPALVCWICRQPLDRTASVRWRGEPVHPDCLIHDPQFQDEIG